MAQEKVFREWNDGPLFCYNRRLTLSQCDRYGRLKHSELLVLLSDAATEDYNRRGLPYGVLAESGVVFLASKIAIRFFADIKGDSIITIKTWESSISGARFNRFYEIDDEDGNALAQAKAVWLAVNPNTRKILRPSAYPYPELINLCDKEVDCMECGKVKLPENPIDLGSRKTLFNDIDVNGHVNNTRYIAFAEDCLPSKFETQYISDIRINFVNEAKLGDTMHFIGGYVEEERRVAVIGKNDEGVTSFECEFYLR